MKVTMKEIAKLLGISEAAVSLALNDKAGVSDLTRKKVKELAQQMGYERNELAQCLSTSQSHRIGLIVPDIENPYYSRMVGCVDAALRERGYRLELAISSNDPEEEKRALRDLVFRQVAGILISPLNRNVKNLSAFDILTDRHIPAVFLSSYYPGLPFPCVMTDLKRGSYELTGYLFRQGRRRLRLLTGPDDLPAFRQRIEGTRDAYLDEQLPWSDETVVVCDRVDFQSAYYTTHELLDLNKPIDAILTVNDYMALGVLKALFERGIKVPEEIAVAGYDDIIYASVATIGVTTVVQDIRQMCELGVDRIIRMAQRGLEPRAERTLLPPSLVVRASTTVRDRERTIKDSTK